MEEKLKKRLGSSVWWDYREWGDHLVSVKERRTLAKCLLGRAFMEPMRKSFQSLKNTQ